MRSPYLDENVSRYLHSLDIRTVWSVSSFVPRLLTLHFPVELVIN